MENIKTVILGDEFDEQLISDLKNLLLKDGGVIIDNKEAVAGSQDYTSYEIKYQNSVVKVEIETFMGISITGNESVIDYLVGCLGSR